MDMIEINIALIDEDTDQPRYQFDEEALQELMNSIDELGLLSPIKVRATEGGRYKIIYGNRRYKACRELGRATIPCIVSTATDEMEIYLEQIAENLTREGFSPVEEAEAFHKLLNDARFRSSVKFLSGKLGKPEAYIKNKCELLKFGKAVRKLIAAGSEIRKDRLTEEQVLPLKDLPMEYRDTLALTFARDETPVPDIKRIAKMFKDESISESLKGKLLYKSGYELLETWSTFEHNRKERERARKAALEAEEAKREAEARRAEERAAQAQAAANAGGQAGGHGRADGTAVSAGNGGAAGAAASSAGTGGTSAAGATGGATTGGMAPGSAVGAATAAFAFAGGERTPSGETPGANGATGGSSVRALLQALAACPPRLPLEANGEQAGPDERAAFAGDVEALIEELEKQLAGWRSVREALTEPAAN